jgi:hypothetical protein
MTRSISFGADKLGTASQRRRMVTVRAFGSPTPLEIRLIVAALNGLCNLTDVVPLAPSGRIGSNSTNVLSPGRQSQHSGDRLSDCVAFR